VNSGGHVVNGIPPSGQASADLVVLVRKGPRGECLPPTQMPEAGLVAAADIGADVDMFTP